MSTIPKHIDTYELQYALGRGSTGEVWKGYDTQLRRDVAIKIIHTDLQSDPHFSTHFTEEGKRIASLNHSNIVPVRSVNITRSPETGETTAYIVMDYIEGQTLSNYLSMTSHKGAFPDISQIVYLFTSLGVAIDYAHQQGIVHGNIKPNNILLNKKDTSHFAAGEPMLTDFGFAQALGAAGADTPFYMSPEQARGEPANNRSDIYALGVILYELCTGVQPFRDESSVAVMMQHINQLPTPPTLINPNIPLALSEVILRAMAKDTATRYAMASLLATAIADACSMQTTTRVSLRSAVEAGDEKGYLDITSGSQESLLGVPHPTKPLRPPIISQPLPAISRPLPTVSRPLPPNSGNIPAVRPVSGPISAKMPAIDRTDRVDRAGQTAPTARIPASFSSTQPNLPVAVPPLQPPAPLAPMPYMPVPLQAPPVPPLPVQRAKARTRITDLPVYAVIIAFVMLLLLIGSAIGTDLLINRGQTGPTGQVFFKDDALGHDDVLHLEMQHIPAPQQGMSYYAWLEDSSGHTQLLGQLGLQNGSINFVYPGDARHSNLLAMAQGFIVTEEPTGSQPQAPSGNPVFSAAFDTAALQSIKAILYATPGLPAKQSVVVDILDTIQSMNDKTGSIVDDLQGNHDFAQIRRQAIRVIEMVDGTAYARSSGDLPASDPTFVNAQIGLLSSPRQIGYIDILNQQVNKVQENAGGDQSLLKHVQNVKNAIADLQNWMQKIRSYDVQVLKAADLNNPAIISVALQLKQAAADSYTGRIIPPNEGPQPTLGSAGAEQAYTECQYMATLNLKKM
jgi:serine/threonine protein kinase